MTKFKCWTQYFIIYSSSLYPKYATIQICCMEFQDSYLVVLIGQPIIHSNWRNLHLFFFNFYNLHVKSFHCIFYCTITQSHFNFNFMMLNGYSPFNKNDFRSIFFLLIGYQLFLK